MFPSMNQKYGNKILTLPGMVKYEELYIIPLSKNSGIGRV